MFSTRKKIAALGVAAAAVATTGIASAYWTTSATGDGSGSTTEGVTETLDFVQASLSAMYPGDDEQTLTVTVTNTDVQSVFVSDVKAYLTVSETNEGTCDAGDFLLGGTAAPGTAETARSLTWLDNDLAEDESADATSTIQFNNLNENQDACKDAAVTIEYIAS